jgi:hypothetical protein
MSDILNSVRAAPATPPAALGGAASVSFGIRHRGRVPAQFVGLARDLRNRILKSSARTDAIAEALISPLRRKPGFTPMPRHRLLASIPRKWRQMADLGRLNLIAEFERGVLRISELRVVADGVTISDEGWAEDEPGLAVALYDLIISPPRFSERMRPIAVLGLHALARRYQRSLDRTDAGVLANIRPLANGGLAAIKTPGEFSIQAPGGGRWVSSVQPGDKILLIRTFYGDFDYEK